MNTVRDTKTPVLIVDDSSEYGLVLHKMLSGGFGYENVTWVESPDEALELLRQGNSSHRLLFVDYNFPGGTTGGELLGTLQKEGLLKDRIAFLITSEPTLENVAEATKAGALGVVAKPFDREELGRQLEKADLRLRTVEMEHF